jgi:hypothetical protein
MGLDRGSGSGHHNPSAAPIGLISPKYNKYSFFLLPFFLLNLSSKFLDLLNLLLNLMLGF